MALSTVAWVLLHQLATKKISHRYVQDQSGGANPQLRSLLPRWQKAIRIYHFLGRLLGDFDNSLLLLALLCVQRLSFPSMLSISASGSQLSFICTFRSVQAVPLGREVLLRPSVPVPSLPTSTNNAGPQLVASHPRAVVMLASAGSVPTGHHKIEE